MADPFEPAVIRVLRQFRATLDSREEAAMLEMARRYRSVQAGVEADITALAYEMAKRREDGRAVTQQMIWRDERFKRVNAQLKEQLGRFEAESLTQIERDQMENGGLGIRAANEAIAATYADAGAFGPMWNRLNLNAIESMIGFAADGSPLSKLLKASYPDALDGLTQALINGMARGLGPAQVARDMMIGSAMGLERALLISRTEMARAYRTGSTKQYRESGVCSGFYRLVKKTTACAACLFRDGEHFTMETELSDHPRGKCIVVPEVEGVGRPKWQTGQEWFGTLDPEQQRGILGPKRYDLWKSGSITLTDISKLHHSDEWGDAPRVATVGELTGG